MQKMLLYVFPGLTTLFMLGMPASLQVSFAFTSLLSLVQSYFLRQSWFRSFLGVQPIVQPTNPTESYSSKSPYSGTMTVYRPPQAIPAEVSPPPPKGILGGAISEIKGAASELMKTARRVRGASETKGGTRKRTAAELKAAMAYEERRKKEMEKKSQSGGRKRINR